MKIIKDICYSDTGHNRQKLDVYLPDCKNFPTFVYFHGGGLETGSKDHHPFVAYLVNRGIAVVLANYRLYPTAVYPQFIQDAASVVAWAHNNMKVYGASNHLYVGGSSAGGYLSMMLCLDKKYLNMYNIDSDKLTGYIMDAGQPTTHMNVLKERGLDPRQVIVDEAAPLFHIKTNAYAPMLIIVADQDIENRYEQTMLLMSTFKSFNGDCPHIKLKVMENNKHCQYNNENDANGNNILATLIYDFIKSI